MDLDRRTLVGAGTLGALMVGAAEAAGPRTVPAAQAAAEGMPATDLGLVAGSDRDQTAVLQRAIDRLAPNGTPLSLPPGRYLAAALRLKPGTRIIGVPGRSMLGLAGQGPLMQGQATPGVHLEGLVLDGRGIAARNDAGIVDLADTSGASLRGLTVTNTPGAGLTLTRASGVIEDCAINRIGMAAIRTLDATGLAIRHNTIRDCANNGILVWRTTAGEDGTMVALNRIERIAAQAGGSGQNGNGINVFRAGSVLVTGNRITDCAYSAIRANSASNVQMTSNSVARAGEVALYAEFAFEGALIASNLIDHAAAGIVATNFNEGGRLVTVTGNMVRSLRRREHEPVDKRGEGIAVEADAVVTGNVIEDAATVGLMIGWHRYMRDVVAAQNLIRRSPLGIAISADRAAGTVLVNGNLISGASRGAIRTLSGWMPVGPDLAREVSSDQRISVTGNVVA